MPKMIAIHPGEVLKEEFLIPLGITPYRLAQELHVPAPRVNDVVLGKRGISADTALRLGRYLSTVLAEPSDAVGFARRRKRLLSSRRT
jgi:addiction module HigA family antidote